MVSRRAWYERANATWPSPLPRCTLVEAQRATRRLWRFMKLKFPPRVEPTTGNRYTTLRYGSLRFNTDRGSWHDLVHVLSHYGCRGGHTKDHARFEARLIRQVVQRGWLQGKLLQRRARPSKVRTIGSPSDQGGSLELQLPKDDLALRIQHVESLLKKAVTRRKRAATIETKWRRRLARLQKKAVAS